MNTPLRKTLRIIAATAIFASLAQLAQAATTYVWNVASPGANNWNVNGNWLPASANPGSSDTAQFSAAGTAANATTVNSVVSANTTITALHFTNTASGTWNVVQIADGMTLTTSGNVIVGAGVATGVGAGDGAVTSAAMVGGGTYQANGSTFVIGNQGNTTINTGTILDLSGLTNFVYNASSGLIGMGISNRCTASLTLANGSNFITAGTINLDTGSSSSSGTAGNLKLGAGTNVLNVGTINIGAGRTAGTATFNTSTGGLRLRGTAGGDSDRVTTITLGNRNTGATGGGTTTGTINLNGHAVDVKIATLNLGQESSAANDHLIGSGVFQFDQGTVDISTVTMGVLTGNQSNNVASGTLTVGAAGTLLINSISLANTSLATNFVSASGTLFVNGGNAVCTNSIVKTGTVLANTGTVAVASSGTLFILGKIGTPANPIDNLNVTNGNLKLRVDGSGAITTNIFATTVNASGTTTFIVDQAIGVTGPTTFPLVAYSTLNGTVAGNFGVTVPGGYIASLVDNSAQKRIDLSISPSVIIVPKIWAGATNGDWDLVTSNWLSSGAVATYADFDTTVFDDSASNSAVSLTAAFSPASVTMSNSTLTYTFSGSGSLTGTNSLTQKGTATTILDNTGSNSYTGGTLIGFGTLQVGNNDANGNLPGGTAVVDNSALVFKRSDNVTNDNAISGTGSLTQDGSGTLTLVGGNGYGATTISAGTLQVGGGGASGSLGSGAVTDNSTLIFNRSDNVTVANVISGSGGVTKNNNNVLTLSAHTSSYAGLTANAGTVRVAGTNAAGAGSITVNPGAAVTLVTTNVPNNIVLAGGTLGAQFASCPNVPGTVTAAAATTSIILMGDTANLNPSQADGTEMNFTNVLHGSGNIIITTVTNDLQADGGSGLRFRGTAASDFSGVLTLSNNVKAELQTTVAGPFSPAGVGTLQVVCGSFFGTNNQQGPTIGGYSELNLRNNGTGDTTLTNDVEVLGTGTAFIDPLGSAPAGTRIVMGGLKIGGGQELGVYLSAAPSHVVVFPRVTLRGGVAKFSPKTPGFGATTSAGSDLELGDITETASSGIIMAGLSNLFLTGSSANAYSGSTTNVSGTMVLNKTSGNAIPGYLAITGGTVTLSNNNQIADGATVNVTGGTLAVNGFNDTVGAVILAGGAISGSGGILSASSYDAQSGSASANLGGAGALTKSTGGTVSLSGVNNYGGNTLVNAGTLALIGSGSIASPSIAVAANAILDVSGATGGTITLASGQALSGNGTVNGSVTVGAGATVAPGASIGSLTVTNAVTLLGTAAMELDKANATNDVISGAASIAYGGTLSLSFTPGSLAAGDSFKLFSAGAYSGSFGSITPANPGANLAWDTTTLTNGVLTVANGVNLTPTNIIASVSGNQLTLGWPADHTGWTLQTNGVSVAEPSSWFALPGSDATNQVVITIDPAKAQVFYRLVH